MKWSLIALCITLALPAVCPWDVRNLERNLLWPRKFSQAVVAMVWAAQNKRSSMTPSAGIIFFVLVWCKWKMQLLGSPWDAITVQSLAVKLSKGEEEMQHLSSLCHLEVIIFVTIIWCKPHREYPQWSGDKIIKGFCFVLNFIPWVLTKLVWDILPIWEWVFKEYVRGD